MWKWLVSEMATLETQPHFRVVGFSFVMAFCVRIEEKIGLESALDKEPTKKMWSDLFPLLYVFTL